MKRFFPALPLLMLACGSDQTPDRSQTPAPKQNATTLSGIVDSLHATVNSATSIDPSQLQAQTSDEIQKMMQIEYKVVELQNNASNDELQNTLTKLGQEGWDCFSVLPNAEKYRIVCKRRPKSFLNYLKYVPFL